MGTNWAQIKPFHRTIKRSLNRFLGRDGIVIFTSIRNKTEKMCRRMRDGPAIVYTPEELMEDS